MMFKVVFDSGDPWYYAKFTRGKIYDAHWEEEMADSSTGIYYTVKCDTGEMIKIYFGHFIPLEVWRETKIEDILNKL